MFGVSTHKSAIFAPAVSRWNCYAGRAQGAGGWRKRKKKERNSVEERQRPQTAVTGMPVLFLLHGVRVLLQHVHALRGGGLVEAPHVVVHLGEALLHVVLGAALPHRPKAEAKRRVVQLREVEETGNRAFVPEVTRRSEKEEEEASKAEPLSRSSQP